jgi:ABC-2 type transport system permease protein
VTRFAALVAFEVRKLAARRLPLIAFALIVLVALAAPWVGHVVDTASSLAQGKGRPEDRFGNGWSALTSGVGTARLFLVIATLVLSGSTLAEEWSQGTIKALLVRPVRRIELLLAKTLVMWGFACSALVVAVVAAGIGGELTQGLYDVTDPFFPERPAKYLFGLMLDYTLLATLMTMPALLAMTTMGLLFSTVFDHPGHATGAAVGALFVLTSAAGLMSDESRAFVFVTHLSGPFDTLDGLAQQFSGVIQAFSPAALAGSAAVSLAWAAALFLASAVLLERRDIGG